MKSVLFSILIASSAAAQVRENVTVEVVEVPVYVYAPDGQPIRGLTKDAFELRVNGRRHPIEFFDAIDLGTRTRSEAPPTARERRLYLLLFDFHFSTQGRLMRAQRAAEYTVEHSDQRTDFFSVATYTSTKGVQFVTPFLSDSVAIRRAIETLSPGSMHDPLGLALSPAERTEWTVEANLATESGFVTGSKGDEADAAMAEAIQGGEAFKEMQHAQQDRINENLLEDLGDLATRLSGLEGQKHVLFLSEGSGLAIPFTDPHSTGILKGAYGRFQAANVFLDVLDIAGIRHTDAPPVFAPVGPRSIPLAMHDSLATISSGTGGRFVNNRNDFKSALDDLAKAQRVVYILGFHRRDNHPGTIDVRVNGLPSGIRVSFRHGFGGPSQSKEVDPLQLADILINDIPQTGLNLSLDVRDRELVVVLPRSEIVPQLADKTPYVDTILYVFDQQGSVVAAKQNRMGFEGVESKEPVAIRQTLDLPPGHYLAKAVSRIGGTTSVGFAKKEFTIE